MPYVALLLLSRSQTNKIRSSFLFVLTTTHISSELRGSIDGISVITDLLPVSRDDTPATTKKEHAQIGKDPG